MEFKLISLELGEDLSIFILELGFDNRSFFLLVSPVISLASARLEIELLVTPVKL